MANKAAPPIAEAAIANHTKAVAELVGAKSDLDAANRRFHDHTALHDAASSGRIKTTASLAMMVAAKAVLDLADADNCSPLDLSVQFGYFASVAMLIYAKANPDSGQALFHAARSGHAASMFTLLSCRSLLPSEASSAAIHAATGGHVEILKLLLCAQADPTWRRLEDGITALICAAYTGHYRACRYLLEVKANVSATVISNSRPAAMEHFPALWLAILRPSFSSS